MAKLLSSFLNTSFSTFDSNEVVQIIGASVNPILGTNTIGDYIESALAGSGIIITNLSTPEGANHTFAIDSSVVVALTKTQTLTNKTFNLTNNTLVGSVAEFNVALSGDNFVTETATQTITNKTLTAPIIGSSGASFTGAASGAINVLATSVAGSNTITLPAVTGTLVTEANTATLTNKTINGSNNTLSNIPNTATTADSANTANAIVTRNASGNFSAGTITATINGNATTATALATGRNFSLTGEVTAPAISFTGAGAVALSTTIATDAVDSSNILALSVSSAKLQANIPDSKLATISTALKVSNSATTATDANTASAIVARDASGNFTAGTITAALTGNASTASAWATGRTITLTGDVTGVSGSWTGSGNISFATAHAAGSIVSADFNTATSLIIYNSAGTVLKTIYSPGS